jgi:peptidylprolyl isomerase
VSAQQDPDWQACNISNPKRASDIDAKIAGCTRILDRGGQSAHSSAIALANRGLAYQNSGDVDRAIADFSEAIRIEPEFPNWRYARATQYESKSDFRLAVADLREAIRLRPNTAAYLDAVRRVEQKLAATANMPATATRQDAAQPQGPSADLDPESTILIDTAKGQIVIKLRTDLAPNHAERIKTLAREHFYDNVPFHRVIENFMAQTGDGQRFNGSGVSGYADLKAEFSNVPFRRGVVGMARKGGDNNSANSQFFIMYKEVPALNGKYTVIGEVAAGMDVVDALKTGEPVDNPDRMTMVQVAADTMRPAAGGDQRVGPPQQTPQVFRMQVQSHPDAGAQCLGVLNAQFVEGARLQTTSCASIASQIFTYDQNTQVLAIGSLCVGLGGRGAPASAVGLGSCTGDASQRWRVVANGDFYQIVGSGDRCLDSASLLIPQNCVVQASTQLWALIEAP